jgi:phosphatidylglycerol:prolipoprotein diacylglycerol transferase
MQRLLAVYVHHLDPFAIRFTETFGIRWYGLAYVAGFVAAFLLIRWFVRIGASELKESQVGDFITLCAVVGTMVGGRLGYMLLYNFDELVSNPLSFFDILGGGMSSHGGMAGITIVAWFYARRTKTSWAGHGDNLVTVAPVGVFFGRLANFVNGELYGRPTAGPIAMKFPDELTDLEPTPAGLAWKFPTAELRALAERAGEVAPELLAKIDAAVAKALASGHDAHYAVVALVQETSRGNAAFRALLGEILTPRHPSQLYEALVEGLLMFAIMLGMRLRWRNLYHGVLTGTFFLLYALGRIVVENFREPDSSMVLGMTKGQFYSIFLALAGIGFLAYGFLRRRTNQLPA